MADRWWHTLLTLVPREQYLRATRAAADMRANFHDEKAENLQLHVVLGEQRTYISALEEQLGEAHAQATQVRSVLLSLPVFEGLVGPAPLGLLVSELARDHGVLEERIERVLDLILARRDMDHIDQDGEEFATLNKIAGLLQGQVTGVPDTVEGLD